jgi:hypothetical protein
LIWVSISILLTSTILKFSWWNKLDEMGKETLPADFDTRVRGTVPQPAPVPSPIAEPATISK